MVSGLFLGCSLYYLLPPVYQARASVVVDLNIEQNWHGSPDNEVFYFLDRETRKLVELAWSDRVISQVEEENGLDVSLLRNEILSLSQPKDGGWHFYASAATPSQAEELASSWAKAFINEVSSARSNQNELGILENINAIPSQIEDLPIVRKGSLLLFGLIGATGGWLIGMLLVLFRKR